MSNNLFPLTGSYKVLDRDNPVDQPMIAALEALRAGWSHEYDLREMTPPVGPDHIMVEFIPNGSALPEQHCYLVPHPDGVEVQPSWGEDFVFRAVHPGATEKVK